ncbi:MAG TPA: D-aminoacyl-tRNA deacylase [Candidatus Anoxymicrobiaceae bacterium]
MVATRAVIQRVKRCAVEVEGCLTAETGKGLLVLLGVASGDGEAEMAYMADKTLNLRIFPDEAGKMNLSVMDIGGEMMVVSQFTLLADTSRGRRPSFVAAADPSLAEPLYQAFVERLRAAGLTVGTGEFGAMMDVTLQNWGPVTIVLDSP